MHPILDKTGNNLFFFHPLKTSGWGRTILLAGLTLLLAWQPTPVHSAPNSATPAMAAAAVILKGKTFQVQLADTPALHTRGLGGHKPLKAGEGMLFVYGQPSRYTFWMKGMGFPIDIIWIQNHTVVYIAHSIPPPTPGTPDSRLPTYTPESEANFVLELAAGQAKSLGLKPGDPVDFRF